MATHYWAVQGMTDPLVLPSTVADRCLRMAEKAHLQVLLWLSHQRMVWDATACGHALGMTPDECEQCLQFWLQQGVVTVADAPADSSVTAVSAARPAPVKPRVQEVLQYQQQHPHFADFLQHVSAIMGKAIGHADTATLLYLIDTVGLPENVLLQEIGYAVSIGKANMRYIEKLALDWADKELTTIEAVEEHIHQLERWQKAADRIEKLLQLPRPLNTPQSEMADRWLGVWGFSEAMIQKAAAIANENTGKFQPAYIDRILERWHAEGVDTPDKIPADGAYPRKKKGVQATNPEKSGLDTDSFDQQLQRYRPKFTSKGE